MFVTNKPNFSKKPDFESMIPYSEWDTSITYNLVVKEQIYCCLKFNHNLFPKLKNMFL